MIISVTLILCNNILWLTLIGDLLLLFIFIFRFYSSGLKMMLQRRLLLKCLTDCLAASVVRIIYLPRPTIILRCGVESCTRLGDQDQIAIPGTCRRSIIFPIPSRSDLAATPEY